MQICRDVVESAHDERHGCQCIRRIGRIARQTRIVYQSIKSKQLGCSTSVQRPGRSYETSRSQGADIGEPIASQNTLEIIIQTIDKTEQIVAENPWLGMLHMRVSRHKRMLVAFSQLDKRTPQLQKFLHDK